MKALNFFEEGRSIMASRSTLNKAIRELQKKWEKLMEFRDLTPEEQIKYDKLITVGDEN